MLFQAMLLAKDLNPSKEEQPQPAPSLTSRSPEEEVGPLSDPLEAFLDYRRKRAREYLAWRGELPRNDPEPNHEKNWSPRPRDVTLRPTQPPESYTRRYSEAYLKLKEERPSGKEEGW